MRQIVDGRILLTGGKNSNLDIVSKDYNVIESIAGSRASSLDEDLSSLVGFSGSSEDDNIYIWIPGNNRVFIVDMNPHLGELEEALVVVHPEAQIFSAATSMRGRRLILLYRNPQSEAFYMSYWEKSNWSTMTNKTLTSKNLHPEGIDFLSSNKHHICGSEHVRRTDPHLYEYSKRYWSASRRFVRRLL